MARLAELSRPGVRDYRQERKTHGGPIGSRDSGVSLSSPFSRFRRPRFINGGDAKVTDRTPRALEIAFHEQVFRSVFDITSTLGLAKLAKGVMIVCNDKAELDELYQFGWLHRDVTPKSIGIEENGNEYIVDFHLALFLNSPYSESARLIRFGTIPFMAPTLLDLALVPKPHSWWHDVTCLVYVVLLVE
ncbi:BQ2448_6082 [Microbotryum intermedium]|uniref:BQ2448_6082 protein n=1 Tax=Microbotryum intermedium TaxID=269621 RepID=A0A238FIP6_9BASI|nr:BQ2448_6082 [Microbotryum intermedium]